MVRSHSGPTLSTVTATHNMSGVSGDKNGVGRSRSSFRRLFHVSVRQAITFVRVPIRHFSYYFTCRYLKASSARNCLNDEVEMQSKSQAAA